MERKKNENEQETKKQISAGQESVSYAAMEQVNRNYKDRLFRSIFREKKNLLSLYNAMNGSDYTDEEQLEIFTVEDVLYLNFKGDVSFLIDPCLYLYEHQSSYNPNMGVRGLLYFAQSYNKYMEVHKLNRFGSKLLRLPKPIFVVFYNGMTWQGEETTIRLSDCFENDGVEPCVEVVARMININYGKNKELMEHCKPLMDYAIFVKKVREYTKAVSLEIAVNRAIDECIEEDRLKEFLEQHRAEVVDIMLDSYSLENYTKIMEYEKEHLAKEMQDLQGELESLQGEYQGLQGEVEDLQGENQNLKGQNQELEENYKNSIIAMVQMALEFYDNETDAIRKTAEKCHMSIEQVTELWNADRQL